MDPSPVSRRTFLAGSAGLELTAWAADPAGALPPLGSTARPAARRAISPLVLSSDLSASPTPQRFVFAIARGAKYASVGTARVGFAAPGTKQASW